MIHWVPTHVARPENGTSVYFTGQRGEQILGRYDQDLFWEQFGGAVFSYVPAMWRPRDDAHDARLS